MSILEQPASRPTLLAKVGELFGVSRAVAIGIVALTGAALAVAVVFGVLSAPKTTITLVAGPEGSVFYSTAQKYAKSLAREGVRLKIVASNGSLENLQRLEDPKGSVDVGFVQDGVAEADDDKLVSLGSVSYQPIMVFHRGAATGTLASLAGRRVSVGTEGSGTRKLALRLLAANGIVPGGATTLLDWSPQQASQALLDGTIDAAFLMGEDAPVAMMRQLMLAPGIDLMSFEQAEAYARRFAWLSVLKLPEGSIDFGKDAPAHDVYLVGPTVELVARKGLHPALSDVLLEAAQEVHSRATLLQRQGEFPAPIEHGFLISADAARFYRSGKSFFYHYLPFWLASLTSRIVVVVVPTLVILIPVVRLIPQAYRWRIQSQIYRWYRAMLALERDLFAEGPERDPAALLRRLDEIEAGVNRLKVPAFFADQFYALRGHIEFVRHLIVRREKE